MLTKNDLNWFGKLLDALGGTTLNKEHVRFLHPLGFLTFVIVLPAFFFLSGIKDMKEMIRDHFRMW